MVSLSTAPRLIVQKSNIDLEVKALALDALQIALSQQLDYSEVDLYVHEQFIESLQKCFKSPQFKIAYSSLQIIPPLLETIKLTSNNLAHHLKCLLTSFAMLLVEKLADGKDKVRDFACDSLISLFELVYINHHHLVSSNLNSVGGSHMVSFMEKMVISHGFNSKSPHAREMSVVFILSCFGLIKDMSVKPFIPALIKLAEDSAETVRMKSQDTIVEFYKFI